MEEEESTSRSLSFLVGQNHTLVHSLSEGPQSFQRRRKISQKRRRRNRDIKNRSNADDKSSSLPTPTAGGAVTATLLPSIPLSVEIQSLFAVGSRVGVGSRSLSESKLGMKRRTASRSRQWDSSPERAMSPFSEWMEDQHLLSSPDMRPPPPMSADVASSERYQLKYNRASTVTASGNSKEKKRKKREDQRSLKILNEKRSQMLLDELKVAIEKKKEAKKIALAEQRMFTAEFELREKLNQPLPPPGNCHLPTLCAPNQHPSHPSFSTFFPNQVEEPNSLGQQLSHSRLSSYQFNVVDPPPLLDQKSEREYQRVLLKSREEKNRKKKKLAESFWKK
jgi:hypothetical protein